MTSKNKVQHKNKEPLFHIVKRDSLPRAQSWMIRGGAIVISLLLSSVIFLLFTGKSPFDMFYAMFYGCFGSIGKIWALLKDTAIMLCIALAVTPAFRMRFWNIGAEGQVLMGCVSAVAPVMWWGGKIPEAVLLLLMFISAIIGAGIWALLPAIFKAQWNTNETLFTLMLNYIATQFVWFCINIWVTDGSGIMGEQQYGHLPSFINSYFVIILAVLIVTALVYVYLNYTKQGYEISVVGESPKTASYIGINVKKVIIRTMIVSGILCGIAGFLIVSGLDHSVHAETSVGGKGFTAIMVSWLAKFNPLLMIASSFLISFLNKGASSLSNDGGSNDYPDMVIGIVLFFIIGCEFFINYQIKFRLKQKEAA